MMAGGGSQRGANLSPLALGDDAELEQTVLAISEHEYRLGREQEKRHVVARSKLSFCVYCCFVIVFFLMLMSGRDLRVETYVSLSVKDALLKEEFPHEFSHIRKTWEDVMTHTEWWQWVQGVVVPVLFPMNRNVTVADGLNDGSRLGYVQRHSRMLGAVRLRQVRVPGEECASGVKPDMPSDDTSFQQSCYPAIKYTSQMNSVMAGNGLDGGVGYNVDEQPFVGSQDPSFKIDFQPCFATEQSTTGKDGRGIIPCGGHSVLFPVHMRKEDAAEKMQRLFDNEFVDLQTRAVVLEFFLYNQNLDVFCSVKVISLFLPGGVVHSNAFSEVFKMTDLNFTEWGLRLFFIGFVLVYLLFGSILDASIFYRENCIPEKERLVKLFGQVDTDGSMELDKDELMGLFTLWQKGAPKPGELEEFLSMMDSDGDGAVSLEEFLDAAARRRDIKTAQNVTIAFKASNNGQLSLDGAEDIMPITRLKQLLIDIGFPSEQLWNIRELQGEMLRISDPDNIYLDDFVRVVTPRLVAIATQCKSIWKDHVLTFWTLFDYVLLFLCSFSWYCFYLWWRSDFRQSYAVQSPSYPVAMYGVCLSYSRERVSLAIATLLVLFRFQKFVANNNRLNVIGRTLSRAGSDLIGFGVYLIIFFLAFTYFTHYAFGHVLYKFGSTTHSQFALFEVFLGQFKYAELRDVNYTTSVIFFFLYFVIIILIMFNIIISVLTESYEEEHDAVNKAGLIGRPLMVQFTQELWASFNFFYRYSTGQITDDQTDELELTVLAELRDKNRLSVDFVSDEVNKWIAKRGFRVPEDMQQEIVFRLQSITKECAQGSPRTRRSVRSLQ